MIIITVCCDLASHGQSWPVNAMPRLFISDGAAAGKAVTSYEPNLSRDTRNLKLCPTT